MRLRSLAALCIASIFVPALLVATGASAQDMTGATYMGNQTCKVCHNKPAEGEQWNKWKAMKHSGAFELLKSDKAVAVGTKLGLAKPPSESPECLQCHVTGYDVATKQAPPEIKPEDGVQCETCHGPASLHVADAKKFKLKKDASIDLAQHHTPPVVEVCLKCHNDKNPNWNPEKYTLKDGSKAGFDYEQATKIIAHPNPTKHEAGAEKKWFE